MCIFIYLFLRTVALIYLVFFLYYQNNCNSVSFSLEKYNFKLHAVFLKSLQYFTH